MSAIVWMPLYVGDYRRDTAHLSAAQHGAYLQLIMHYWQLGGLPDDDEQLARIASMSVAEWKKNRFVIKAFFSDGWRHGRIDEELKKAIELYEKRSAAGKTGNEKRWEKHRRAIAGGSQSQSQSHEGLGQGEKNPGGNSTDLSGPGTTRAALTLITGQGGAR